MDYGVINMLTKMPENPTHGDVGNNKSVNLVGTSSPVHSTHESKPDPFREIRFGYWPFRLL